MHILREMSFKVWLGRHAEAALREVGLAPGQRVLDYGCGSGTFTIPAARIVGAKGKVYALDISKRALTEVKDKAAKEGLYNIETFLSDETKVASLLEDDSVDAVILYDVLHSVEGKQLLLRELHRILDDEGFLSVYPMHLEKEEVLKLAGRDNSFILRDQYQRILNFIKTNVQSIRNSNRQIVPEGLKGQENEHRIWACSLLAFGALSGDRPSID